ncbi:Hypothetical protein NTJ_10697 [Nesidiocoris tenuis]|uniref:Uncharacterized protein n=1 Tax=Nesidiocoris tenuis TaxID=355587 RepID=A0ABN7B0X1_9HEMI|nr:Hypothetical protein NTJ_10697 [Nesidiocoris tenuis]
MKLGLYKRHLGSGNRALQHGKSSRPIGARIVKSREIRTGGAGDSNFDALLFADASLYPKVAVSDVEFVGASEPTFGSLASLQSLQIKSPLVRISSLKF